MEKPDNRTPSERLTDALIDSLDQMSDEEIIAENREIYGDQYEAEIQKTKDAALRALREFRKNGSPQG